MFGGAGVAAGTLIGPSAVALIAAMPVVIIGDVLSRVLCFKKQHKRRPVIEHVWDTDPLLRFLKPEYIRLESLFKPNEAMFALVDELKEQGYSVGVASNIAPETLQLLQKRYPEHFKKFDFIVSPSEANRWVDKKQPKKFFDQLQQQAYGKKFVVIDDKQENCDNAEEEDMLSICFNGDMEELYAALRDKGVDVD